MKREYEITIIARADLTAEVLKTLRDRVTALIAQHQGTVLHFIDLGKRSLCYEIDKQTKGIYWYVNFIAEGTAIAEVERFCRLDEGIFRFLTVVLSDQSDVVARQAQHEADLKKLQGYFGVVLMKGAEATSEVVGPIAGSA